MARINVRKLFDQSREQIEKAVLGDVPKENREIDIQEAFLTSTRTVGTYVTLDWNHISDIRKLQQAITSYSRNPTRKRPLNIIMFAEPGAGKTHFIRCLARSFRSVEVEDVSFSLATLRSSEDLVHPLDSVRNLKVIDRLPVLFLDEFDANPSNYALLLPLLWEGALRARGRNLESLDHSPAGAEQQGDRSAQCGVEQ